ncbi:hypothetical protein GOQ30_11395 [Flavobacterium sp. TP390]|uniref:Uncharacterized protein n=1 Tax=Flavobacterium profundi TaxID=1774945 RepID=A0A6I4IJ25_9FLAO|nr:hypothetical protein [Flavobacterium profundi]MVO09763.1 hypothetical protein [Flavobacterium profundi]
MRREFDYVGKEKLDLAKQEHRDVVIQRNKNLEYFIKNDICVYDNKDILKIKVEFTVTINCLVCGNTIDKDKEVDFEEISNIHLPVVKCSCCETSYHYTNKNEVYQIALKKTEKPTKKK